MEARNSLGCRGGMLNIQNTMIGPIMGASGIGRAKTFKTTWASARTIFTQASKAKMSAMPSTIIRLVLAVVYVMIDSIIGYNDAINRRKWSASVICVLVELPCYVFSLL